MKGLIQGIVEHIPKNTFFDAHFVINQLYHNAESTEEYIEYCAGKNIEVAHSGLSKIIKSLDNVEYMDDSKSWSYNIHQVASPCQLYKKIK
jgi:arginine repressor